MKRLRELVEEAMKGVKAKIMQRERSLEGQEVEVGMVIMTRATESDG